MYATRFWNNLQHKKTNIQSAGEVMVNTKLTENWLYMGIKL